MVRRVLWAAGAVVVLAAVGVGLYLGMRPTPAGRPIQVVLDFFPNPNHVPLYLAAEDPESGIEILVPANPSDPVRLAASRTVDVALTPQTNYLMARAEGLPLVAIGALIDHTLGGLLALAPQGTLSVADLAGRRIGYALEPLEPVLWQTMLECAGVDPDSVEMLNVGFNTVVALATGQVDAIGAFRNYERLQVEMMGLDAVFFPQEDYCVPETYDIILVANPDTVVERGCELRRFLARLSDGVAQTLADPDAAYEQFLTANPELDDELDRVSFDATVALYAVGLRHDDPAVWAAMQQYLVDRGLLPAAAPTEELYTAELLPSGDDT